METAAQFSFMSTVGFRLDKRVNHTGECVLPHRENEKSRSRDANSKRSVYLEGHVWLGLFLLTRMLRVDHWSLPAGGREGIRFLRERFSQMRMSDPVMAS